MERIQPVEEPTNEPRVDQVTHRTEESTSSEEAMAKRTDDNEVANESAYAERQDETEE